MPIEVHPATAARWADLVAVFGRRGADPSWCWCRTPLRLRPAEGQVPGAVPDNRRALREEIAHAEPPPGLIAYVDDQPAGWARVGPRSGYPGVAGNRALARVLTNDDTGVWWVACFAVAGRFRRSGVGLALLRGAVEFARQHGATTLEGHPVDVAALQAARVSGSALYTGTQAMYAAAGFTEAGRTFPSRPVMRLRL